MERELTPLEQQLALGPEKLSDWIANLERRAERPQANDVLGIAEGAEFYAIRDHSVSWAQLAVRAYDLVDALRAMRVRTRFISEMGPQTGDLLRDPKKVLDRFLAELPVSFDVAMQKAAPWKRTDLPIGQRLPLDDLKALRRIKNLLGPIEKLRNMGHVPADSECNQWLRIRKELP